MKETKFSLDQKKDFIDYLIKIKDNKHCYSYLSFGGSPIEKEEIECLIKNKKCTVIQTRYLQRVKFEIDLSLNNLIQFLSKYNIFEWGYSTENNPWFYFYDKETKQNIKYNDFDFDVEITGFWDTTEYGEISRWIDDVSLKEKKLLEDYFKDDLGSDYYQCEGYEYSGEVETSWEPGDVSCLEIDVLKTSAYDSKSEKTYDQKVIERIIFYREQ